MAFLAHFLPNETKFYRMLETLSAEARRSVESLVSLIEDASTESTDRQQIERNIEAAQAAAKQTLDTLTAEVCRTFITPFDREDLQALAIDLYQIPKTIEKIKERLALMPKDPQHPQRYQRFSPQVQLIAQQSVLLASLIDMLSKNHGSHHLLEKTAQLNTLEHQGDDVLCQQLNVLYLSDIHPKELVWAKDLLDLLERVIDDHRDAADVTLQVVLKHS
jgi:hypothetical protein